MRQLLLKRLKNQKGLTLIELLAVIVILGIIAAIAVPAIGGIIDNSKRDAHAANAIQMINAAKLAVVGDSEARPANGQSTYLSLGWLVAQGYLEEVRDPDGTEDNYEPGSDGIVNVAHDDEPTVTDSGYTTGSHVRITAINNQMTYEVFTFNGDRGARAEADSDGTEVDDYVAELEVNRGNVK